MESFAWYVGFFLISQDQNPMIFNELVKPDHVGTSDDENWFRMLIYMPKILLSANFFLKLVVVRGEFQRSVNAASTCVIWNNRLHFVLHLI